MLMPRINYEAIKYEDHCGCDYQDMTVAAIYAGFENDYQPTWKRFPKPAIQERELASVDDVVLNKMKNCTDWITRQGVLREIAIREFAA